MVSASKIGSMVLSQLVDAVTDHLPDHLPDLPYLPVRRPPKGRGVRRLAIPLAVAALGAGAYLYVRSRRSTTSVGADSPAESYAHT
jgi:hypothetical protein